MSSINKTLVSTKADQKPARVAPRDFDWLKPRISLRSLESYCRRMNIGLKAGVDILRILESEARQGSKRQQDVARDMIERVRSGATLAQAYQAQDPWFPKLFVQMVGAGEEAGGLDRIFLHLADYYKDLRQARTRFLALIAWPMIQLSIALLVVSGAILLQGLLTRGDNGPTYDAAGLGLSGWRGFAIFWIVVGIIACGIGVTAFGLWRNWFDCHKLLMPWLRRVPVIGTVLTTGALSRFSMSLSMLLNAGVDAKRSVQSAFRSTGNFFYMQGMKQALDEITRGKSLADSFRSTGVFPTEFVEAVEVGEISGSETESLEHLAADYTRRSQAALTQLAVSTSLAIWILVAGLLIYLIISLVLQYVNFLYSLMK